MVFSISSRFKKLTMAISPYISTCQAESERVLAFAASRDPSFGNNYFMGFIINIFEKGCKRKQQLIVR